MRRRRGEVMARDKLLEDALLQRVKHTHGVERIICTTKDCTNIAAGGYGLCFVCVEGVMRSAREQITQLKADLANRDVDFRNLVLVFDLIQEDFGRFAGHTAECISDPEYPGRWKCDCDFLKAKERWK